MKVSVLILVCYTASVIQASPSIDKEAKKGFQNDLLSRGDIKCDAAKGECMSKDKCDGKILNWGKCEGMKDICCASDDGPTKPEPEMIKCKDMEGTCISKEEADECDGTIRNHWKCKGKDTICCDGKVVSPKPPKGTKKCKKVGGKCKSEKKCKGKMINPLGKCKGKNDVCCIKKKQKCEKIGGKCKSEKDCNGMMNKMGKCKGKKDVCCIKE